VSDNLLTAGPRPALCRSVLFVSGLALESLGPALVGGADLVCIDIEDAVPPERKAHALESVLAAVASIDAAASARLIVRINSLRSVNGLADLHAFLTRPHALAALVLPKVETADEVRWAGALADDAGSGLRLLAIIETPSGLEHCLAIAGAHPRLWALFFGGFDLSTALGCDMAWEPLLYARSRVVHAAAGAGIQVLDSPFPDLADGPGLQAAAARAVSRNDRQDCEGRSPGRRHQRRLLAYAGRARSRAPRDRSARARPGGAACDRWQAGRAADHQAASADPGVGRFDLVRRVPVRLTCPRARAPGSCA